MGIRSFHPMLTLSGLGGPAVALISPDLCMASSDASLPLDLTTSAVGYLTLGIFVPAYALVMAEEFTGVALMEQARGTYTFFGHLK